MLQQMQSVKRAVIGLMRVSPILLCLAGCGSDGGSKDGTTQLSDDEFQAGLDGLGVDYKSIAAAPLKDVNGNILPDNYNPLSEQTFAISSIPEIFMAENSLTGTVMPNQGLINPDNFSVLASDGTALAKEGHSVVTKCEAGDVDKDGIDEVITSIFDMTEGSLLLRETKKDKESGKYSFTAITSINDASISSDNIDVYRTCLELADVDGDGKDEILIAYNNTLVIFNDKTAGYAQLLKKTFSPVVSGSAQYLRVRCGNFDYDSAKEIVVTNGSASSTAKAEYFIYDDLAADSIMSKVMDAAGSSGQFDKIRAANLVIGDFNGDKLQEIKFCGQGNEDSGSSFNTSHYMYTIGQSFNANSKSVFSVQGTYYTSFSSGKIMMSMAAGNLRSDAAFDEYLLESDVFSKGNDFVGSDYLSTAAFDGIKIGDVNGDGKGEIVAYLKDEYGRLALLVGTYYPRHGSFGFANDKWKDLTTDTIDGAICLPCTLPSNRPKKYSTVMEFVKHEILFTEPKILAVIASPPYWKGINQAGGSTSFGESTTQGSGSGYEVGFSAYQALGFEAGIDGIFKAKAIGKITAGFDYSSSQTTEVKDSYSHTTPSGEDMVVFTCIPYDVFYYKVISTNDPKTKEGSIITVNKPRLSKTIPVTVDYYNKNNGLFNDISIDILCHTKGDPYSYASYETISSKIDAATIGYYSPLVKAKTVGQGSGTTSISMEKTITNEQNYNVKLQVGYEGEVNIASISIGGGYELHGGYSYSISCSKSTAIEGVVGNISADDFSTSRSFTWGLASWFYQDETGKQKFPVTTYWVKP